MAQDLIHAPQVGVCRNPLLGMLQGDMRLVLLGSTVADHAPAVHGYLVCRLNGEWLLRESWGYPLAVGDIVEFYDMPQGRTALQVLLAVVALVYLYYSVGDVYGASAIYSIGSIAINLLVPPRQAGPEEAALGIFSASLAGNAARLDQPIWKNCGRVKITPPFAAQPYVEYRPSDLAEPTKDCDQYYHALFAIGVGDHELEKAFIGKTPISHFKDVLVAKYLAPGEKPTLVDANVYTSAEVASSELDTPLVGGVVTHPYVGPFAACRPGDRIAAIGVDVGANQGLGETKSSGGTGSRTAAWQVEIREINDFGAPIAEWQVLANESRTAKTNTPQRWSNRYELAAPIRCEVRLARTDTKGTDANERDGIQWIGLRAYLAGRAAQSAVPGEPVISYGPNKRVFAWYDASSGASTPALVQPDYAAGLQIYGSDVVWRTPAAAKYLADIRPSGGATTYYRDDAGLPKKLPAATENFGAVVYDSANSNFFALGPKLSSTLQYEYRIALDGSVISKTATTSTPVGPNGNFVGALVYFNSAWRTWVNDGNLCHYGVRHASNPSWTWSTTWLEPTSRAAAYGNVAGAYVIGSTLVVGWLEKGGGSDYVFFLALRSTTGTAPWNDVSNAFYLPAGAPSWSLHIDGGFQRLGDSACLYFSRGSDPWVAIVSDDFETVTDEELTLDGGVPPGGDGTVAVGGMRAFVGHASGDYVVAQVYEFIGGDVYASRLAVSTDGIAFDSVPDVDLLSSIDGEPAVNRGQFVQPLLSQGAKFLYERRLAQEYSTTGGQILPSLLLNDQTAHFEVVMRASEQLSSFTQRDFSMIVRGLVRTWHPVTGWSAPVFTRNAAWWLADLWLNADWGEGLPESRVDLQGLYDWSLILDARQDRFDHTFNSARDSWECAQLVARSGRARAFRRYTSVYTVARDELVTLPVAALTPRTCQPDSMVLHTNLPLRERPDGIVVQYLSNRTWDIETIECPCPGVSAMQNPVWIMLEGVTGAKHAEREGLYQAASMALRQSKITAKVEMEGMLLSFMAPVRWQPQIPGYGQSGDVAFWNGTTLVMGLTEKPAFGSVPLYLTLQRDDGSLTTPVAVAPGPTAWDVTLPAPPDFALVLDDATRERPKFLLGPLAGGDELVKVASISDGGLTEDGAQLFQVDAQIDDDRVHAADVHLLPGPGDVQDPIDSGADFDDGGGGLAVLVRLEGHGVHAGLTSTGKASITFNPNGSISWSTEIGSPPTSTESGTYPGEWLTSIVEPSVAAGYEIWADDVGDTRAGLTAYGYVCTGPTYSWQALSAARTWSFEASDAAFTAGYMPAAERWLLRFRIKRIGGSVELDNAKVSLGVIREDGSGYDSGGAGGPGKVICTAMNERYGLPPLDNLVWLAYSRRHLTPEHQVGYHRVFVPLVAYGFGGETLPRSIVRRALEWIGRTRTADLRAEMRGTNPRPFIRALRRAAEWLLHRIGKGL